MFLFLERKGIEKLYPQNCVLLLRVRMERCEGERRTAQRPGDQPESQARPRVANRRSVTMVLMKDSQIKWPPDVRPGAFLCSKGIYLVNLRFINFGVLSQIRPCLKNNNALCYINKMAIAAIWTNAKNEAPSLS